jgi:transposase-like protein
MFTNRQKKLQVFDSPLDALERFVRILNEGVNEIPISEETLAILRQRVQDWFDSGKNVTKLFASRPMLKEVGFLTFARATSSSEVEVIHTPNTELNDPETFADALFLNFLINPHHASLRSRCAYCDMYFINGTRREVVRYCTKECGKQFTSRLANQKRRERKYAENLKRVTGAIQKLSPRESGNSWKNAVSAKAGVSKRWITIAAQKKVISEPVNSSANSRDGRIGKRKL